jgi:hypothetical protein
MPTSEKDRTYRVWGLPSDASAHDSEKILSSLLDKDGQKTKPTVQSLGLDPYKFGRSVPKVATVTFEQTPGVLSEGDLWNFSVDGAASRTKFHITIDTHFLGFTPLNSVKDDEDHKTE